MCSSDLTSKITAAMKMVSAAKLKRAQDGHARSKPYAEKLDEMLKRVLASVDAPDHPLLKTRDVGRIRYVIVSSDRGLAGGFNNNLFKAFLRRPADSVPVQALGIGRRARDMAARLKNVEAISAGETNLPNYANASAIAEQLVRDYLDGKCDKVVLVYNQFKNAAVQNVMVEQMLPIVPQAAAAGAKKTTNDYIFEPAKEELVLELIPKSIKVQLYKALLDSNASEHGARMTAMNKATDNAGELLRDLRLSYNKARQAAITGEILEIVAGAEALNG